ncbi:pilus assembly protein [Castellaniella daejeonensis]|uniref:Pilus assembly protein n=1 Tax=Castellaniella daejeonensis TaxID=659013 RepID=A0ABN0U3E7_9BURK
MTQPRRVQNQSGIAAIELSLTLIVLFMLIFAVVSYGALFWAQQTLTHVAADAARHGLALSYAAQAEDDAAPAALEDPVKEYACDVANRTAVLQAFWPAATSSACSMSGFAHAEAGACPADIRSVKPNSRCLVVQLTVLVDGWPLLNMMRQFARLLSANAGRGWIPTELTAKSVVIISPTPGGMP